MEMKEMVNFKVIDNFLPADVFTELHDLVLPQPVDYKYEDGTSAYKGVPHAGPLQGPQIDWCYNPEVISPEKGDGNWRLFYLIHLLYNQTLTSPYASKIIPPIEKLLDYKTLIRMKINMFPNTEKLHEHGMHTDFDYSHKAAIFSINTCDGYTKLEDGTKIDSVANRMLLFDASKLHSSTTTTNQTVRVNININYF